MYSFEEIKDRMFSATELDTNEGSVLYNAFVPVALELSKMHNYLDNSKDLFYAQTGEGVFLDKRLEEYGIERIKGTYAIKEIKLYDDKNKPIDAELDKRIVIEDIVYIITKKLDTGIYESTCTVIGVVGNNLEGICSSLDFLPNVAQIIMGKTLVYAREVEDDETYRKRASYLMRFFPFGGNISDYFNKFINIDGVGGVLVHSTPNNQAGFVDIYLLDNNNTSSQAFIDSIVNKINSESISNTIGLGISPINHNLELKPFLTEDINIEVKLSYVSPLSKNSIDDTIRKAITDYFSEVIKQLEDLETSFLFNKDNKTYVLEIVNNKLISIIINITGIKDVIFVKLNNKTNNYKIDFNKIPKITEIIIGE